MIDECYNNYSEKLENYQNIVYQSPVKASISILPMNELSIMAETLVNLTSFKRQMSHNQQETVGGPTDVAIITIGRSAGENYENGYIPITEIELDLGVSLLPIA